MSRSPIHKNHFTVAQASNFLARYAPELSELHQMALQLKKRGYDIYRHKYFGGMGPNGDREHPPELEKMIRLLEFFDKMGVLVKDVETGLIDFPCLRSNGEEVYLCFKLGETSLNYWHHINDGFIGRKPLTEL